MIPFLDYKAVNKPHFDEIENAVRRVLRSGWYVLGPEVSGFEEEYASYCGSKFCVGVSSGLDALILILRAWKILGRLKDGDEVIVPANTYIASILAVTENNLTPILVEPDLATCNLDPNKLEMAITPKTRAVMAVHLFGQCADMDPINEFADTHGLLVLEDAAQSQGALYKGRQSGSIGHAAAHSFYPGKNLGAIGEAGAVTTDDVEVENVIRMLRNYGSKVKYENKLQGLNNRLDELQAAILRVKLKHLDRENEKRKAVANVYLREIKNPAVTLPSTLDCCLPCWHLFVVRVARRDHFIKYLEGHGVGVAIHYPIPPHQQKAYAKWNSCSYPITESIHERCVSLPISPAHTEDDARVVSSAINQYNEV